MMLYSDETPKLHTSIGVCDLLVVSSHHLDHESVNSGARTTHFESLAITLLFLDAHDIFKKGNTGEANKMPCLYQFK